MKLLRVFFHTSLILLLPLVAVSCSDDDDNKNGNGEQEQVFLPQEITSKANESIVKTTFTYDDQNRIITRTEEGGYKDTIKIAYEGDKVKSIYHGRVSGDNPSLSETMQCNYGVVITFESTVIDKKKYTFDSDAKGLVTGFAWDDLLYTFEYDEKGNIKSEKKNQGGEQYGSATYTYNDKPSIYANQNTPKWLLMYMGYQNEFVNCPDKIEHSFDSNYDDIRMEYKYEYTDGIPVVKELKRFENEELTSTTNYTIKYASFDKK